MSSSRNGCLSVLGSDGVAVYGRRTVTTKSWWPDIPVKLSPRVVFNLSLASQYTCKWPSSLVRSPACQNSLCGVDGDELPFLSEVPSILWQAVGPWNEKSVPYGTLPWCKTLSNIHWQHNKHSPKLEVRLPCSLSLLIVMSAEASDAVLLSCTTPSSHSKRRAAHLPLVYPPVALTC